MRIPSIRGKGSPRSTRNFHRPESELDSLCKADKDTSAQEEFLRFQVDEIKKAKLVEGEDAELEQELKIISAAEQLKASSFEVYGMLDGDDSVSSSISALEALNRAVSIVGRLVELDPSLKPELGNAGGGCSRCRRSGAQHPVTIREHGVRRGRLSEIEERLELIRNLKRKYGQSIPEIWLIWRESRASWADFSIPRNASKNLKSNQLQSGRNWVNWDANFQMSECWLPKS